MDVEERLSQVAVSQLSKNKKLQQVLEHRSAFEDAIKREEGDIPAERSFHETDRTVEGADINVCVRIRPLLDYEHRAGFFGTVFASNPKVYTLEPKMDVRGNPRPVKSTYDVDFAFGPDHRNEDVYSAVAGPLIEMALRGGVSTILAYGQTGSGKTHTIGGILDRLGTDMFRSSTGDKENKSHLKFHVSFFELLGNDATDLLDEGKRRVEIAEDQFGKIVTRNASEVPVETPEQFREVVSRAMASRTTATTFKNDTSSRSHAICSVRVENTRFRAAEDGRLFVVDLAGSETAADAQFHDKSRVKETKLINASLMALKECIRNRALSAADLDKFYHVPYRQSRLTLLLKDAFEVESRRHCKTVFVACVSPSVADMAMTMNTLRYVAPIKIGEVKEKVEPNPANPANWGNERLREWVRRRSKGRIDPDRLCPFESGMQMLRMPETEFIGRILEVHPEVGEKGAKLFYVALWKLLVDARSKERKTKLRRQKVHIDYESNAVDADFEREMRSEGLGDGEMMARRIVRAHVEEGGEDAGSSQGHSNVRIYLPK